MHARCAQAFLASRDSCVQVRFQAACAVSREPLPLNAFLLQIGQNPVSKATPANVALRLWILPKALLQGLQWIAIYRDQWPEPWEDFVQGPMRALLQHVHCLRTCAKANCGCSSWHGLETAGEPEAILEVFGRQYVDLSYKPCSPQQAAIFNVCLRIPFDASRMMPQASMLEISLGEVLVVEQKPREVPDVLSPPLVASRSAIQRFKARPGDGGPAPVDHQTPLEAVLGFQSAPSTAVQGRHARFGQPAESIRCRCPTCDPA